MANVGDFQVIESDCLALMPKLREHCVDAIVSDPPYGLSFMGKQWDHGVPGAPFWVEALRVAKPGAYLVAFGGSRTYHRLACAVEDAGWELRDCLQWLYGTGFPKSHNLEGDRAGWGTALKPAYEPIILARAPFKGTVAKNVVEHGTGALNIDGCRVATEDALVRPEILRVDNAVLGKGLGAGTQTEPEAGRWPANVILDPEAAELLGEPARFFYQAKASKGEREAGLEDFTPQIVSDGREVVNDTAYQRDATLRRNTHPTVKPIELMRWLCRLVTPPGGLVLDPFCGSGTTGCAAVQEGFQFLGVEREPEFARLAEARIAHWASK